jgi:hypothetical protein
VAWGSEGGSGSAGESAAAQKIDRLKSKYTMDSERHAHAAALQLAEEPPKTVDPQPAIEMFDTPELPSGVTKLAASEITPPATHPPTEKPAPSGLGDNVELF